MSHFYVLLAVYIMNHVRSMENPGILIVKKDLESIETTSLKNIYFGIREEDPVCPEEPDYPENGTELDPCTDTGAARKTRKVAFYLLTEGTKIMKLIKSQKELSLKFKLYTESWSMLNQ